MDKQNGEKKIGPIVAILIIVLVLIIAALYMFASRINQPAIPTDNSTADVSANASDTASLQSDLNGSTNGLDNQNF